MRTYVTVTVTVTAEEQTALEDANLVLDYEETDVSTENEIKEGVTDGLNLFLDTPIILKLVKDVYSVILHLMQLKK